MLKSNNKVTKTMVSLALTCALLLLATATLNSVQVQAAGTTSTMMRIMLRRAWKAGVASIDFGVTNNYLTRPKNLNRFLDLNAAPVVMGSGNFASVAAFPTNEAGKNIFKLKHVCVKMPKGDNRKEVDFEIGFNKYVGEKIGDFWKTISVTKAAGDNVPLLSTFNHYSLKHKLLSKDSNTEMQGPVLVMKCGPPGSSTLGHFFSNEVFRNQPDVFAVAWVQAARNLLRALAYLDNLGVAHRDVNPDNILAWLAPNKDSAGKTIPGEKRVIVKLFDFGCSQSRATSPARGHNIVSDNTKLRFSVIPPCEADSSAAASADPPANFDSFGYINTLETLLYMPFMGTLSLTTCAEALGIAQSLKEPYPKPGTAKPSFISGQLSKGLRFNTKKVMFDAPPAKKAPLMGSDLLNKLLSYFPKEPMAWTTDNCKPGFLPAAECSKIKLPSPSKLLAELEPAFTKFLTDHSAVKLKLKTDKKTSVITAADATGNDADIGTNADEAPVAPASNDALYIVATEVVEDLYNNKGTGAAPAVNTQPFETAPVADN